LDRVLDEKGFVKPNEYLVVYFPMWKGLLAYRVIGRVNQGFEKIERGTLPFTVTKDGTTYPEGVIPGEYYSPKYKISWNILPEERRTDMFWYDDPNRLLHVYLKFHPTRLIRNYIFITEGTQQARYLDVVTADPTQPSDFGFWRGEIELVVLPYMHIAFQQYNNTNMNLRTYLSIKYGEYKVELIKEPKLLWEFMTRKRVAHWVTYPGEVQFIPDCFRRSYGLSQPFPLRTRLEEVVEDLKAINPGLTPTYYSGEEYGGEYVE